MLSRAHSCGSAQAFPHAHGPRRCGAQVAHRKVPEVVSMTMSSESSAGALGTLAPRARAAHVAMARLVRRRGPVPRWWRDASVAGGWLVLLMVTALWVKGGGIQQLTSVSDALMSTGRLTGLIASALLLIQVFLMARVPWVEQAWGQDELARTHRLVGFTSFNLMLAHIVLITLGYAAGTSAGIVGTFVDLVRQLPGHAAAPCRHRRAGHGGRDLGEEGPQAAALRVLAPHPPLRLPRRRPGPAAPAVDRHRLPVVHDGHGLLVDPVRRVRRCGAGLPGRAAAVALAALAAAGARRPGRGPGRHDGHRRWRWGAPDAGARRPVLPVAVPGRPGLDPRQPVLHLGGTRRPDPAVHRGPRRRRVRAARDAAARYPGARRGPLRPDARRRARSPQGAAHGVRHRHHPDARPPRGARPGPR